MGRRVSRAGHRGLKDVIYLYVCMYVFIYLSPAEKQTFSLAILKTDFLGDTLV